MKLLSIRTAFIPREKLGMFEFNLGRLGFCDEHGEDNESDLLLRVTSFKGFHSNARQTPNLLKYI